MADNWVSPTGHSDPDGKWSNETSAYDDDLETYAFNDERNYDHYLELMIAEISCNKVRIHACDVFFGTSYDPDLDIDVYYDGNWHNIFSGTITKETWVEKSIGATKQVTKARVKSNTSNRNLRLTEFDFNIAPAPAVGRSFGFIIG